VQRRIVGLDLGVASDHTAVVLDEAGAELARRRVRPVRASLEALRQAALAGAETATVVEVVVEPTGPAWLPVAVFFAATGDVVYRVSSQKAADLRRYFRRHHKTNRIDATTLARIAILEGGALRPVELARGLAAELDREVRVTERLTEEIAARKVRIRDLARQLMPTSGRAFSATIAHTDLEILRAWGRPQGPCGTRRPSPGRVRRHGQPGPPRPRHGGGVGRRGDRRRGVVRHHRRRPVRRARRRPGHRGRAAGRARGGPGAPRAPA
jgi:hypothetical protein